MNILLATDNFYPATGGMEAVTLNLAKGLVQRGHSVSVIVNLRHSPFKRYEEINRIKVYRVRMGTFGPTSKSAPGIMRPGQNAALELYRVLNREKPDLVNVHFLTSGITTYVRLFKQIFNYRLVASAHGSDVLVMPLESKSCHEQARRAVERADAVTASSRSLLESLLKLTGNGEEKATYIYNGVDTEASVNHRMSDNSIFTAGRLVHEKGIDVLIEAFRLLKDRGFEGTLVIAGDGPERARLESMITGLGLQDSVVLTGTLSPAEVKQHLWTCALAAMPARSDTFGIFNLEAMAAGKAVVASNVGVMPEMVRDGYNGLLFRSEDPGDMAGKMSYLLNNEEKRLAMGNNAREFVNNNFSWDRMTDSYERLYRSVLNNGDGSART